VLAKSEIYPFVPTFHPRRNTRGYCKYWNGVLRDKDFASQRLCREGAWEEAIMISQGYKQKNYPQTTKFLKTYQELKFKKETRISCGFLVNLAEREGIAPRLSKYRIANSFLSAPITSNWCHFY
jgi:hypothetical protein